jgi:hypothetical protein
LLAVGHWNGVSFIQFGDAFQDASTNAGINGVVAATGPASRNGLEVYVGIASTVNTISGDFVILRSVVSGNPVIFPSDVSSEISSSTFYANEMDNNDVQLVTGSPLATLTGTSIHFVPEPSVVMSGVLGVLGLFRRRR